MKCILIMEKIKEVAINLRKELYFWSTFFGMRKENIVFKAA